MGSASRRGGKYGNGYPPFSLSAGCSNERARGSLSASSLINKLTRPSVFRSKICANCGTFVPRWSRVSQIFRCPPHHRRIGEFVYFGETAKLAHEFTFRRTVRLCTVRPRSVLHTTIITTHQSRGIFRAPCAVKEGLLETTRIAFELKCARYIRIQSPNCLNAACKIFMFF